MDWYLKTPTPKNAVEQKRRLAFTRENGDADVVSPDIIDEAKTPTGKLPGVVVNKEAPTWNTKRKRRPLNLDRVPVRMDGARPTGAADTGNM